ncbi:hypothetical protein MOC78_03420 [Bacillus inaquosorum]|uniref:hypothetical protein n=1 Tax=Bacillus inaquosorum TaxID=483913 RepID=UPI002281BE51|nr:hypothetical protein [Bacillus inaquosorum]MCY8386528.1 hypothetical protein [Bacillus inaquosorum]
MNKAICKTVSGETHTITGDGAAWLYKVILHEGKEGPALSLPVGWVGFDGTAINFTNVESIKFENEEA